MLYLAWHALNTTLFLHQVASYGGKLRFMLQFSIAADDNPMLRDVDVEIIVRQ